MKLFFSILLICVLQIVSKCDEELQDLNIVPRAHPETLNIPVQKNIKLINARKFGNLKASEARKANYKKLTFRKGYTVFPPIEERKMHDAPENVFFQGDNTERKPRVKKVLPEYKLSVFRRKRSVSSSNSSSTAIDQASRRKLIPNQDKPVERKIKRKPRKTRLRKGAKRVKPKVMKGEVTYVMKSKKLKRNATKLKNLREGKTKSPARLRYTTKHKNKTHVKSKVKDAVKKLKLPVNEDKKGKVRNRRLIAARDAKVQDYPYVVSIQKSGQHWCAGALLNQRLVVTTANCVWKANRMSRMKVRAGSWYADRGGQVAKIQEVARHPAWSIRTNPDNDLALLLLDRNIKFSDTVHGVDIPNRAMLPPFDDVWVTSWGSERRDGIFESADVTLQVYHAMLLSPEKCNNVTQRFGVSVTRNFICVAQTGRRAPCTRDTGAPAVSDGILWGVASWGIRKLCGTERYPAMFSYLASRSNLDFLTNATHYLMSEKRYYPFPDRFVDYRVRTTTVSTEGPMYL